MRLVVAIVLLLSPWLYSDSIQKTSELMLSQYFGNEVKTVFSYFVIPPELKNRVEHNAKQRFFKDKIYYWKISNSDSTIGFALLDNVMGKAMPITLLVVFDANGHTINTDIIKYRESIGGEVSNPRWLKQFNGLSQREIMDPNIRIDGISGATISVNAVSKGIKKLCLLFPDVKKYSISKESENPHE